MYHIHAHKSIKICQDVLQALIIKVGRSSESH